MSRLTVGGRIALGFAAVIAVMTAMIVVTTLQTKTAEERAVRVYERRAPAAFAAQRLYAATVGSANALRGFIITRDPKMREDWNAQWREIEREIAVLDAFSTHFVDPSHRRAWVETRRLLAPFRAAQARVIETAATQPTEAASADLRSQVLPLFARIRARLVGLDGHGGMIGAQAELLAADLQSAGAAVRRADTLLMLGGALTVLLAGLVGGLTTRTITAPLVQLTAALRTMALGRFDVDVPGAGRADELGEVAKAAIVFRENGLERDRLHREAELIRAELDRIYDNAPVGLGVLDRRLRFLRVNAAMAEMNGVPAAAHIGRALAEVLPAIAPMVTESLLGVQRTSTALWDVEVTSETPAQPGVLRTWILNVAPLRRPEEGGSILVSVLEITARKQAEAQAKLLMHELNHRVKNALATVLSIASLTWRTTTDLEAFKPAFQARLMALSHTHDLLTAERWEGAWLGELFERELRPYAAEGHAHLRGDPVRLTPQAALTLGLVAHELTTNAAKYGALSTPGGQVALEWRVDERRLRLAWREDGGPPVRAPQRRGFGSRLIEASVAGELGGQAMFDYAREGLSCTMELPLQRIAVEAGRVQAAEAAASA